MNLLDMEIFGWIFMIGGAVIIVLLIIILISILIMMIRGIWFSSSQCRITTDVAISTDGGATYTRNYLFPCYRNTIYLKYEISARGYGLFADFLLCTIPFTIEISELSRISVSLHECSGIDTEIRNLGKGLKVLRETPFFFIAKGRKPETAKIILKCERHSNESETSFVFQLNFQQKWLYKYSKLATLEYQR